MQAQRRVGALLDWFSAHWWIDLVLVAAAVAAWWHFGGHWCPTFLDGGAAYYASASSFAGIALAAATFTCAFFFQSEKPVIQQLRRVYQHDARTSWTWILTALLTSAVTPIAAAALGPAAPEISFGMASGAVLLAVLSFLRVVLWFRLTTRAPEGKRPDGEHQSRTKRTTYVGPGARPTD